MVDKLQQHWSFFSQWSNNPTRYSQNNLSTNTIQPKITHKSINSHWVELSKYDWHILDNLSTIASDVNIPQRPIIVLKWLSSGLYEMPVCNNLLKQMWIWGIEDESMACQNGKYTVCAKNFNILITNGIFCKCLNTSWFCSTPNEHW